MTAPLLGLLRAPPPQLFFTGKGGVGKTSLACAVAIALADAGKRVLLVSTDPASNLDEMFGQVLTDTPRPISDVPGLSAMNIDPEAAAEAYRSRVLAQLAPDVTEMERATVREQLSGACTTEIAAFGLRHGHRPVGRGAGADIAGQRRLLAALSLVSGT